MAYNFGLKDHNTGERQCLLYELMHSMFPRAPKGTKIKAASSPKTLKKFGGILTIEEFRKQNIETKVNYRFIKPPMVVILPQIEEIHAEQLNMMKKSKVLRENRKFIPLNLKEVERAMKNIEKKKKQRAPNCLEVTMGITTKI